MTFETSKKIDKWVKEHQKKCICNSFDGAQFAYEFVPTAIVGVQTVKCMKCRESIVDYLD